MVVIIIPISFGIITGVIGKAKGSSFVIWSLVGFILPVIGLVAAIMARNENEDPRRECPNCNALVPIATQVCGRCGEDMDYPDELVAPAIYAPPLVAAGAQGNSPEVEGDEDPADSL